MTPQEIKQQAKTLYSSDYDWEAYNKGYLDCYEVNKVEELKNHIENLEKQLLEPAETRIEKMLAQHGGFNMTLQNDLMRASILAFIEMMKSTEGAENYMVLTVNDGNENYDLKISRKNGKTAEDIVMDRDAQIAKLRELLDQAYEEMRQRGAGCPNFLEFQILEALKNQSQ